MKNRIFRNLTIITIAFITIHVISTFAWSAQIILKWSPNTEYDLGGYKIYYGTDSRSYGTPIDVGNVTQFTLTGLTGGMTYFVVLTAYDMSQNESGYSNEINWVATDPAPIQVISPTIPPSSGGKTKAKGKGKGHALNFLMREIESTAFAAPNEESLIAQSAMYLVVSETTVQGSPIGNVKKYGISTVVESNNPSDSTNPITSSNPINPVVLDSTNKPVLDSNNVIKDSSKSDWSSQVDGREIDKGGLGEVLLKRDKPRNIFTFLGDTNLTAESNAFDISNKKITANLLGVGSTERDKLIQYIQGYDSYATRRESDPLQKRRWLLGGIANSRPLVVPYENSQSVIFIGANDGMLHAFDDATGEELWGFIPYELLGHLKNLPNTRSPQYFVDGSPKAYISESQKIIVFGLGKGGSHYYAVDVTDRGNPRFLWEIGPDTTGYSEMGQAWSTPQIGKVKYGKGEKTVTFIGGGYDENQSKGIVGDKKGRAVYVIDVLTGTQIWRWDHGKDGDMKYSIPSDVSKVDTNGDGCVDRLYVGDTGGRLWRFDIEESDPNAWSGAILFNSNTDTAGGSRKIFSRPDVTLEKGYEMVFFGTGDRERPGEIKTINQIYGIKDKGLNSTLSERDLENVTGGIDLENIQEKQGWFISLENKGEKALSSPVLLFGVAYFTTFAPSGTGNGGIARIYALDYKNGSPMLNLNPENDTGGVKVDLSDRSKVIGTGIPSNTVISALEGLPIAFTGFSGGVYSTPLRKNTTIIPIWWREVSKK